MAGFSGGAGLPTAKGLPGKVGTVPRGLPRVGKGVGGRLGTVARSLPPGPLSQPPVPGSQTPGQSSGQPSPLDATYFANVAANNAKVNGQIAALNQANSYGATDLQAALAKLAQAEPQNQLKLEQQANNRGALYSSVYGQNAGNLASQYAQQQGQLQQTNARQTAARNSQIGLDQQGMTDYAIQQALASTGRAANAASKDLTLGLTGPQTTGAPGTTAAQTPLTPLTPGLAKGQATTIRTIPRGRLSVSRLKGVPSKATLIKR